MCGRFSFIITSRQKIKDEFNIKSTPKELVTRYNAAPSQNLPVITNTEPGKIVFFRWGLIPSWAKDTKIGYKMINARAETVTEKPSFRTAFKKRRCLVLADGFYEWKKNKDGNIPYRITLKDDSPFAFAGLWETWHDPEGKELNSFTIITTDANTMLKKLHNRMPVILLPEQKEEWLDTDRPIDKTLKLLTPFPGKNMKAYPVSTLVNSPKNDLPEIVNPV